MINVRGPDYLFHMDQGHTAVQLHTRDGRAGECDLVTVHCDEEDNLRGFAFIPESTRADITPCVAMEFTETESASFAWSGIVANANQALSFTGDPALRSIECTNSSGEMAHYTMTVNALDETSGAGGEVQVGPFQVPPGATHRVSVREGADLREVLSEIDQDGDGQPETREWVWANRTDGVPGSSTVFRITRDSASGEVTLQWTPNLSRAVVEFSADLASWQMLAGPLEGTEWSGSVPATSVCGVRLSRWPPEPSLFARKSRISPKSDRPTI